MEELSKIEMRREEIEQLMGGNGRALKGVEEEQYLRHRGRRPS